MSIPDEKSRLRREMKIARSKLNPAERTRASLALGGLLRPFLREHPLQSVGVYLATPAEISLDPLIETLLAEGVEVSAPRINLQLNTMAFIRLHSLTEVQIGPWNLREPLGDEAVIPATVLVPGLAFNEQGHRLGMGAGWYDRTLTPEITTVGICYDWQIVPTVPTEDHDQRMNWIFSEQRQWGPF
ncbi:5-formyltetrahydrofolate cyclo-ligase [Abditibacteriota bacterium]|nr:5-formyltetrahydrofolate cyclo-ligase [Abditibacteriota bacterium]